MFALRLTTPADIPILHRLMRDFARYEKLEHRFKISEAALHDVLFGARPALESMLAEVETTTVGFALWYLTFGTFSGSWGLFVEDIYIDPAHRGRGIGLALFRHMARVAIERGC
ncbi:MAG TPA: GNAT family N-acetyltransferase, partial [Acetobacteraceae bacterium]|nr:GNAT family N-acetyltransferase [Acetobacteraceae bacterium]